MKLQSIRFRRQNEYDHIPNQPITVLGRRVKLGDHIVRIYLFLLMFILPIDWFSPTGNLLREGGAKPAIPLLILGSVLILLLKPSVILNMHKSTYRAGLLLMGIFMLGSVAFWINSLFSWSDYGYAKSPITQFMAQGILFFLFVVAVITHANLFRNSDWRDFVLRIIPIVVMIHLTVVFLEYANILSPGGSLISLFRTAIIGRPCGLMSEPSYFGAFAGMYGTALFLVRPVPQYRLRCILSIILFTVAVLIRAKTLIPVMICAVMVAVWRRPKSLLRIRSIPIAMAILALSSYVIIANSALDMQENLSSIMRIGATVLALNVARSGYAITGIGFGQFHFFFRPGFAPSFLYRSTEVASQFSPSIESRASTYNIYVRILLETGFIGLILFMRMLYRIMKSARNDPRLETYYGMLLLASSLGFLLTQDTYYYPPLVIGLSIVLGSVADSPTNCSLDSS